MPPGGPVISYVMCLGLKGFVWSPVPSAAAAVASTPNRSRIRTTAYAPIATTTTRSSGIHTFLNSRNTLCLLTLPVVTRYRTPSATRRPSIEADVVGQTRDGTQVPRPAVTVPHCQIRGRVDGVRPITPELR